MTCQQLYALLGSMSFEQRQQQDLVVQVGMRRSEERQIQGYVSGEAGYSFRLVVKSDDDDEAEQQLCEEMYSQWQSSPPPSADRCLLAASPAKPPP